MKKINPDVLRGTFSSLHVTNKLSNIDEVNGIEVLGQVYYSDPSEIDTDADGLSDYEEVKGINIYNFISDPNLTDTDNDGLSDFEQFEIN